MELKIKISEGSSIVISQGEDMNIFARWEADGILNGVSSTITPDDFVEMLNWYNYQKSIGNDDLLY